MILTSIMKDLKKLVLGVEVKYSRKAKEAETIESLRASDMYIEAMYGTDTYHSYTNFDIEAIENAGLTYPDYDPIELSEDKTKIPLNKRNDVVSEQRKIIIRDYVELNEYYRVLIGLPPLSHTESDFIYVDNEIATEHLIPSDIPIHQLSDDDLFILESIGYLDKIVSENPDKPYLSHLGLSNRVDLLLARENSSNFSILKSHKSDVPESFYSEFLSIYEQSREYFTTIIYIPEYSESYELYDNFIALCIMIMTIQRMLANSVKYGIQRDYFDWSFIQALYESYHVPLTDNVPIEYHVTLIKNLNNLLRYKSTDKVLFDICSLLGYERINIYEYYLVKEHKLDENENPVFYYKESVDENGNIVLVEDKERMYDLYFQSTNIAERNVTLAMNDTSNKLDYRQVIINDPYWWDDDELRDVMYNNDFNFEETKYLSLTMMYKMTEMLFEITYSLRMILDKKDEENSIRLILPKLNPDKEFRLFDVIVFLICMICKKSGFTDYVITEPSKISHIYGFDFNEESINTIKNLISGNEDILDKTIVTYFNNLTINESSDVNRLFIQIRELNDILVSKMATAKTIKEYRIYQEIFKICMVSQTQTEMFTKNDGEVATSYLEYLKDADNMLAEFIINSDEGEMNQMLDHTISRLTDLIPGLQYFYILNDNDNPLFNAIISLLKFFKSYTTDLTSYNIIYIFDSKYYQMIKLICDIERISGNINIMEDLHISYSDIIHKYEVTLNKLKDYINLNEEVRIKIKISTDDKLIIRDIFNIISEFKIKSNLNIKDYIKLIKEVRYQDIYKLIEDITYNFKLTHGDKILFSDDYIIRFITLITSMIILRDNCNIISKDKMKELLYLTEKVFAIHVSTYLKDNQLISDDYSISDTIFINDSSDELFFDNITSLLTNIKISESMFKKESYKLIRE